MSPREILEGIRQDAEMLRAFHQTNGATVGEATALGSILGRVARLQREASSLEAQAGRIGMGVSA